MNRRLKIMTRVAVFAALVFIFSYFAVFLHNVNPSFFVVFAAGFLWGGWAGIGVGMIGFFLWSNFNPFGPAPLPLIVAQMIGISFTALLGCLIKRVSGDRGGVRIMFLLIGAGMLSGLLYHIAVDAVDAYLYQPFWPRLAGGLIFSLITIISNAIMFPLFFPALKIIGVREQRSGI